MFGVVAVSRGVRCRSDTAARLVPEAHAPLRCFPRFHPCPRARSTADITSSSFPRENFFFFPTPLITTSSSHHPPLRSSTSVTAVTASSLIEPRTLASNTLTMNSSPLLLLLGLIGFVVAQVIDNDSGLSSLPQCGVSPLPVFPLPPL